MLHCVWLIRTRQIAVLLLVLFLAACSGLGERRKAPAGISDASGEAVDSSTTGVGRVAPADDSIPAVPAPIVEPADPAHSLLMVAALQARSLGNSSRAVALLERAQRIDPDNAQLYLELARTHFEAGNVSQGRATAERGLLFCRDAECAALRALLE